MRFNSVQIVYIKPVLNRFYFSLYSEMWINGNYTHCRIKEITLNACIHIDSFYILFTTDVHITAQTSRVTIYLFNNQGGMLYQSRIIAKDCSESDIWKADDDEYFGYIKNFQFISPNEISFDFALNSWRLKLLKEPISYSAKIYKKCHNLLYKPYPHGILACFFSFIIRCRLTSLPKELNKTYFDLSVV